LQFIGDDPRFSNQQLSLVARHLEHVARAMSRHVDAVELLGALAD
jgi:hypothetical protein